MFSHSQAIAVFRASPLPSLLLQADSPLFPIAEVSDAYLEITGKARNELIGYSLPDGFPDNGNSPAEDVNTLKKSLEHVLATKSPHAMADQEMTLPAPGMTRSGTGDVRCWSPLNTPVFNDKGEVDFIIHALREIPLDITGKELTAEQENEALVKLKERIKEQYCLYRISNLKDNKLSIEELLEQAVTMLPEGWQYTDVTASIEFDGEIYSTPGFRETKWILSAEADIMDNQTLVAKVAYLEEKPVGDEGVFLREEQNLINSVVNHLSLKIENILSQQKLEEKQQALDKAYELARIGNWEFDMITRELYWSAVTKEVHGVDKDHVPGLESTINLFKEGTDRDIFRQTVSDAVENEKPFDVELKIISGKGDERWIRAAGEPEYKDGICTHFYGISQDVSDRKQAEEDLQLSEQRFKTLVQDGSDLIAILDHEANYIYVSPTSAAILGTPADYYIGKNALDFIHEEDQGKILSLLSELSSEQRISITPYRFRDAEGNWRWIETTLTNMMEDPAIGGLVANSRDITEQIENEKELRQLSLVASKTTDVVVITDPEDQIKWVNDAFKKLTGYSLEECAGRNPGALLQGPNTDQETIKRLQKAIGNQESITEEILNYTRDGRTYWLDMTIDPVFDERGVCTDFIAIERNITRQKKEEQRLKLLESAITHTTESVVIIEAQPSDLPGRKIIYANEGFTNMTGYNKKEVIGQTLHFLNGPKTDQEERLKLRKAIEKWQPAEAEFINYRKNGEWFWINISMVPVTDQKGNYTHWISIGRDVSEQKNQQQQLLESLKEKETLLAEIHHRVKNNLAVVSGMMQLQAGEEDNQEVITRLFDSVVRIKTMANIHEQLYQSNSFTRLEFSENIKILTASIVQTFQMEMKIKLDFNCETVQLNINQAIPCSLIVNEIVTNILKHAFTGLKAGKILITLSENDEKNTIHLNVSDNGNGLPPGFDKTGGQGSLGLQLVDVLARQLKADYRYDSLDTGTAFTIQFKKAELKGIGNNFI
ncbi:MAG: PAS domain S-box protein [Balneolaceae bacterium]